MQTPPLKSAALLGTGFVINQGILNPEMLFLKRKKSMCQGSFVNMSAGFSLPRDESRQTLCPSFRALACNDSECQCVLSLRSWTDLIDKVRSLIVAIIGVGTPDR